jgi:membrane protease YdiL (CAAX protease family)
MEERKLLQIGWSQFTLFILFLLGISIVAGFLAGITGEIFEVNLIDFMFVGYNALIVDFVLFLVVFISYKKVRIFVLQSFDLSPMKSLRTYGYIAGGIFVFSITQYLMISLLGIENATQQASDLKIGTITSLLDYSLFFLGAVLLTPLKEEFVFRGLAHRFFEVRYHFLVGLVISSVLFGILHLGFPISATIMGIIFVILYRLTNSLVPSIALHMIWNFIAFVSVLLEN